MRRRLCSAIILGRRILAVSIAPATAWGETQRRGSNCVWLEIRKHPAQEVDHEAKCTTRAWDGAAPLEAHALEGWRGAGGDDRGSTLAVNGRGKPRTSRWR